MLSQTKPIRTRILSKGVFFWYIFLPLLVLADFAGIENVLRWAYLGKTADFEGAYLGKTADFEGFKIFCLKSWKVSQTSQEFQIL